MEIETARVESGIDRAPLYRGTWRALRTVEEDVSAIKVDRTARLPLIDALRLPTTEDGVDETIPAMTPLAAFAEGQFPDAADHDALRNIIRPDAPLVVGIRIVEKAYRLYHL